MKDLEKYGFRKYHEDKTSCFWKLDLSSGCIKILLSVLNKGNWCYDIYFDMNDIDDFFVIANRYECETDEQLHFLLTGSSRLNVLL